MEENKKDRRKTGLLLSILGVISLVLITAGVTYAFFSYAKEGQTENVITTGTIQFAYNETDANGAGILLQDALPISDATGMALDGTAGGRQSFHFTVTSLTPSTAKIPYIVTVKKIDGSTIADDQVKLYLVASGSEQGNGTTVASNVVKTFNELPTISTFTSVNGLDYATLLGSAVTDSTTERVLFTGLVPANSNANGNTDTSYATNFVLRMWLSGDDSNTTADYSPYEFMSNTAVTAAGANAIDAEAKIRSGDFITSTTYYAKSATKECSVAGYTTENDCTTNGGSWASERDAYQRIAYVNTTAKTVYSIGQAVDAHNAVDDGLGNYTFTDLSASGFTTTEQYYQINGQTYTVKVNVYAEGAKVTSGS